ncbi:MAG TPA: hypothetical protein VE398_26545, partial [Acidobacteriota bacterium]|nr:hypothetical protein [Acidobacteriota bacterium]
MATTKAKSGNTGKRTKNRKIKIFKIAALLIAIPGIAAAIFLIRYYYVFNGIIEDKFGKRYDLSGIEIYASPTVLYPGKRIQLSELEQKARRLGYEERNTAGSTSSANFQRTRTNQLTISNDAS